MKSPGGDVVCLVGLGLHLDHGVTGSYSGQEVRFWEVMNMLARRLPPSDGQPFHDPGKGGLPTIQKIAAVRKSKYH